MRKTLIILAVAATGAAALAGASEAGLDLRFLKGDAVSSAESTPLAKYGMSGCRVEKTLRYDYEGKPYLKKVRVCA